MIFENISDNEIEIPKGLKFDTCKVTDLFTKIYLSPIANKAMIVTIPRNKEFVEVINNKIILKNKNMNDNSDNYIDIPEGLKFDTLKTKGEFIQVCLLPIGKSPKTITIPRDKEFVKVDNRKIILKNK